VSEEIPKAAPLVGSYGFTPPVGQDVLVNHAAKLDEQSAQSTILVGELHHRLQNTLSVVLALSRLTARTVNTVEEFQVAFGQRIEAMARTNALMLRGQVQAISVQVALETELQPYLDDKGQVTLICDPLEVSPAAALNLSLIFHELATNAVKYGALAKPSGRLVVECRADGAGGLIHWREQLTWPLKPSRRVGSGSLLITRLARSLGGVSQIDLLPNGLDAKITFKLGGED
jgi:two-component system, chemotaxis family, CheB/CheR fusion protein